MRFSVLHKTTYRYTSPVFYSIQHLRLTPREEPQQRSLRWRIHAPGNLTQSLDAYGNISHTLALTESHGDVEIDARGSSRCSARSRTRSGVNRRRRPKRHGSRPRSRSPCGPRFRRRSKSTRRRPRSSWSRGRSAVPRAGFYCAYQPPSTFQATPRTWSAAGEQRNTTSPASCSVVTNCNDGCFSPSRDFLAAS